MAEFTISALTAQARALATVAHADAGVNNSRVDFHTADGTRLVSIVLAKPCATVVDGVITLTPATAAGSMVEVDGQAAYGVWVSADGDNVATGGASDATGDGPFFIEGVVGTQLRAGGLVTLGAVEIS